MRFCIFTIFLLSIVSGIANASLTWEPVTRFGKVPSRGNGELYYPSGVAVNHSNGEVFIADSLNSLIQRFTADGEFLNHWIFGGGIGLAVDSIDGSIYVGSVSSNRIHKFDPLGNQLAVWGGSGSNPGQFNKPRDVAVNPITRNVFVLDADNKRVQEFTPTGELVQTWPSDQALFNPYGIDIDPTGSFVWIANTGAVSVRKYDLTGNLIFSFGSLGSGPGFFRWPRGITTDAAGNIFVAVTDMEHIQKFDSNGNFLQMFMGPENDLQGPAHPRAVDVNKVTGHIYTTASYANRIDHFDETGAHIKSWGHHDRDGLFLSTPMGIEVDPLNKVVYVADTNSHLIKKFTFDGDFLGQYGNWPFVHRDETAIHFPASIATDAYGNFWALNEGVVYLDDPSWGTDKYVRQFDAHGNLLFAFAHPDFTGSMGDVAINKADDEVYVANTRMHKIMRFDFNGNLLGEWGSQGNGPGQFKSPAGMALDVTANVLLVADVGNQRIQKFTLDGTYLASYGGPGTDPGQFNLRHYGGITFDERGNFYVADTGNHRVQAFNSDGDLLAVIGSYGTGPGQLRSPIAVAFDDELLFILEAAQREVEIIRVQPLTQETVWIDDAVPANAILGGGWEFDTTDPVPQSGTQTHRSVGTTGVMQHYFYNSTDILTIASGDILFAYVYLDPDNPPQEIMLQWHSGGSWSHRAYWGANLINWGSDGTSSRYHMGPLPALGTWVRLEVPASAVGLEAGAAVTGMAFTQYDGRVTWDSTGKTSEVTTSSPSTPPPEPPSPGDIVWIDDAPPVGSAIIGTWDWIGADPAPMSGSLAHHRTVGTGTHQHYFYNASETMDINSGDTLFAYVHLDQDNPPNEIMLQWRQGNSWNHRAYWGANLINWGTDGTASRRYMGPLPSAGGWVRLEIPASAIALESTTVNGMAFTLYNGSATWDAAGKY